MELYNQAGRLTDTWNLNWLTTRWSDGFILYSGNGKIQNPGTFNIQTDSGFIANGSGGVFINTGILRKEVTSGETILGTSSGDSARNFVFLNTGSVFVDSGTLELGGFENNPTHTGSFQTAVGTKLAFESGGTGNGHTFSAGSDFSNAGTVRFGNGTATFGGTYSGAGAVEINSSAGDPDVQFNVDLTAERIDFDRGTFGGIGKVTISTLDWTEGTLSGGQKTVNSSLSISGTGTKNLSTILRSNGSASWTEGSIGSTGTLENAGSFTLAFTEATSLTPAFKNLSGATLTKFDSNDLNFNGAISNAGAIQLSLGTFNINGGYTQTGGSLVTLVTCHMSHS